MTKSLTDLRLERAARTSPLRPERSYRAVVGEGQTHVAEMQRLTEEHDDLVIRAAAEQSQRPRKSGEKATPPERVTQIRARMAELRDLMASYEGDLTIRATKQDGEWSQWRIDHPARDDGEPGHRDDMMLTGGCCNSDDLIEDLATYVVAWDGDLLQPGDFEALELLRPDKKVIAATVVGLYESGDDLPKLLGDLSALLKSETFSGSPSV